MGNIVKNSKINIGLIILMFVGVFALNQTYFFKEKKNFRCLVHENDSSPEYFVINEKNDSVYYELGILGNNEIKSLPKNSEYSRNDYIDIFFKDIDCPTQIESMEIVDEDVVESFRLWRMKKDLEKNESK